MNPRRGSTPRVIGFFSRVLAALILAAPLAWLLRLFARRVNNWGHSTANQAAILEYAKEYAKRTHNPPPLLYYFLVMAIAGLIYVCLIELLAYPLRRFVFRYRDRPAPVST
jgi:amino acid permease